MGIEKSVKPTFSSEKVGSFEPTTTFKTFLRPVIDLKGTGAQIKRLRKLRGYSVHDLQVIFGFDYPQAIYAWEQGKNAPTIDNLLVLSYLFDVNISEIVVSSNIEIKIYNAEKTA